MRRLFKDDNKSPFILSAGWLFADLLLALAMLFLAANTVSIPKPPVTPTPTITKIHVTATPTRTPSPRVLEHNYCRIVSNVSNLNSFLNNLSSAINQLEPQINSQHFLKGRHVGIAIAYGGASDGNESRGVQAATQVYAVLRDLDSKNTPFTGTSYYEPIFTRNFGPTTVVIDVYLVVRQGNFGETCDNNHNPV